MAWLDEATHLLLGALTAVLPADANVDYVDQAQVWNRLGQQDNLTVDKQDLGPPATPIEVELPDDAWATLGDSGPLVDLRGLHRLQPDADGLGGGEDVLAIDFRGNRFIALPADSLAGYADSDPTYLYHQGYVLPDDANVEYGSAVDKYLADTTATPIEVPCDPDAWETLSDSAPIIEERGLYRLTLENDPLGSYADSVPTVDKRGNHFIEPPADPLGSYADPAPIIERIELGNTPITVPLDTDGLGSYADSAPTIDYRGIYRLAPAADPLGSYADTTPTIDRRGNHFIAFTADSLGSYADASPTIDQRASIAIAFAPDAWQTLSDDRTIMRNLRVDLSDPWGLRSEPLGIPLTDSNVAYADSVTCLAGIPVNATEPITLIWTVSDIGGGTIDGYRVYRGITSEVYSAYYQIADPAARSVGVTTAVPAGTWYVAVAAYNEEGISAYSNEVIISYAVYGDSVVYSQPQASFILTDARPAISDVLAARLTINIADTDAKDIFADTLSTITDIPMLVESDARPALEDSIVIAEAFDARGADSLGSYADAKASAHTYAANITDSAAFIDDALTVARGEYVEMEILVSLDEALGGYADDRTVQMWGYEDWRVNVTDSLGLEADAWNGFVTYQAELTDNAEVPSDAIATFANLSVSLVETATPPQDSIALAAHLALPCPADGLGLQADSVVVTYIANRHIALSDLLAEKADALAGFLTYAVPLTDEQIFSDMAVGIFRGIENQIPAIFTDDLNAYVDSVGGVQIIRATCAVDSLDPHADALTWFEGGILFEFFRLNELHDRYALKELKERYRARDIDRQYAAEEDST